jgi:hypothetical protein
MVDLIWSVHNLPNNGYIVAVYVLMHKETTSALSGYHYKYTLIFMTL